MRVCVLSEPFESCHLHEYDSRIKVVNCGAGGLIPDADLYVWDAGTKFDLSFEISTRPDRQHLILAGRHQLETIAAVRERACIVLKPVRKPLLKLFLDLALKVWESRAQCCPAEATRREKDAFLQYVVDVNLLLQQHAQERHDFFACALHDLRTPLTAIHGYCGLLADEQLGSVDAPQRDLLRRMEYSSRRMMRLTSGAFGVVTDEPFEDVKNLQESDIEEAVTQALHDVAPLLHEKNITVQTELQPSEVTISFEPEQIQQVLVNLIENSCKFTPRNGNIQIRGYLLPETARLTKPTRAAEILRRTPNGYRIDIKDSGPGIPSELADRIFEPYASFNSAAGKHAASRSGTGLGLAICRSIMLANRGTIWATPSTEGGEFSLVLPTGKAKGNFGGGWTESTLGLKEAAS